MNQYKNTYKKMTLKFQEVRSGIGAKILDYLDWYPENNETFVIQILKWHCLPHVLDRSDLENKEIARYCASVLEAKARAIRELWDLPKPLDREISSTANDVKDNGLSSTETSQTLKVKEDINNKAEKICKTRRQKILKF